MASDMVNDLVGVGVGAVKGFATLVGVALGVLVAKFGAETIISVLNLGVDALKAIIA
jgi:preprotein translocase subunit SecD